MKGRWLIVCGPSGAGKDSVIAWVAGVLADDPRIVFARWLMRRPGGCVVVNRSREHAATLGGRDDVCCALITAQAQVRQAGLQTRARESACAVARRLARSATVPQPTSCAVNRNNGGIEAAGRSLRQHLLALCE